VVIAFITDLSVCRKILEHLKLPSIAPEIKPARVEDDWPVDEWWDDEGEGEGGNSPPGSASRAPIGTCASRLTRRGGDFILREMELEADGLSYPPP
jgi:hypothetical protein